MPFWKTDLTGRALVLPRAAWDDQHASALECALPMDEGTTDRHGDVPKAPNTEITVAAVPAPTLATGQNARFYGSCCSFAGGAGLTVTFHRSLFGASSPDFTVESWVRVAETGDGALFSIGTDQVTVAIAGPNIVLCGDTSATFARAVWAHVAVVRNGSTTVTLFVNGVPTCTSSPAIVATTTCKAFRVACLASDMRVYSKAKYAANFASSFVPTVVPASDITRVANSTTVSIGVTPSTYRTMRVYAGFADPGSGPSTEVAFSARAAEYAAPTEITCTVASTAYTLTGTSVSVTTTGFTATAPGSVTIFASKTSGDPAPTTVSDRTALSATGAASTTAFFPSAGQWYIYARFSNADGLFAVSILQATGAGVTVADYALPTVTSSTVPALVEGVTATCSLVLTGSNTGSLTTANMKLELVASVASVASVAATNVAYNASDGTVGFTLAGLTRGAWVLQATISAPLANSRYAVTRTVGSFLVDGAAGFTYPTALTVTPTSVVPGTSNVLTLNVTPVPAQTVQCTLYLGGTLDAAVAAGGTQATLAAGTTGPVTFDVASSVMGRSYVFARIVTPSGVTGPTMQSAAVETYVFHTAVASVSGPVYAYRQNVTITLSGGASIQSTASVSYASTSTASAPTLVGTYTLKADGTVVFPFEPGVAAPVFFFVKPRSPGGHERPSSLVSGETTVSEYTFPTVASSIVPSLVEGVAATCSIALAGANVSTFVAANMKVSVGSAVATSVTYVASTGAVSFSVTPVRGVWPLSIEISAPLAISAFSTTRTVGTLLVDGAAGFTYPTAVSVSPMLTAGVAVSATVTVTPAPGMSGGQCSVFVGATESLALATTAATAALSAAGTASVTLTAPQVDQTLVFVRVLTPSGVLGPVVRSARVPVYTLPSSVRSVSVPSVSQSLTGTISVSLSGASTLASSTATVAYASTPNAATPTAVGTFALSKSGTITFPVAVATTGPVYFYVKARSPAGQDQAAFIVSPAISVIPAAVTDYAAFRTFGASNTAKWTAFSSAFLAAYYKSMEGAVFRAFFDEIMSNDVPSWAATRTKPGVIADVSETPYHTDPKRGAWWSGYINDTRYGFRRVWWEFPTPRVVTSIVIYGNVFGRASANIRDEVVASNDGVNFVRIPTQWSVSGSDTVEDTFHLRYDRRKKGGEYAFWLHATNRSLVSTQGVTTAPEPGKVCGSSVGFGGAAVEIALLNMSAYRYYGIGSVGSGDSIPIGSPYISVHGRHTVSRLPFGGGGASYIPDPADGGMSLFWPVVKYPADYFGQTFPWTRLGVDSGGLPVYTPDLAMFAIPQVHATSGVPPPVMYKHWRIRAASSFWAACGPSAAIYLWKLGMYRDSATATADTFGVVSDNYVQQDSNELNVTGVVVPKGTESRDRMFRNIQEWTETSTMYVWPWGDLPYTKVFAQYANFTSEATYVGISLDVHGVIGAIRFANSMYFDASVRGGALIVEAATAEEPTKWVPMVCTTAGGAKLGREGLIATSAASAAAAVVNLTNTLFSVAPYADTYTPPTGVGPAVVPGASLQVGTKKQGCTIRLTGAVWTAAANARDDFSVHLASVSSGQVGPVDRVGPIKCNCEVTAYSTTTGVLTFDATPTAQGLCSFAVVVRSGEGTGITVAQIQSAEAYVLVEPSGASADAHPRVAAVAVPALFAGTATACSITLTGTGASTLVASNIGITLGTTAATSVVYAATTATAFFTLTPPVAGTLPLTLQLISQGVTRSIGSFVVSPAVTGLTYTAPSTVYAQTGTALALSVTGYDATGVTVYASKTTADPSPTAVAARVELSASGTATAVATFPSAGQWYVYAWLSKADGVFSEPAARQGGGAVTVVDYPLPTVVEPVQGSLVFFAGVPARYALVLTGTNAESLVSAGIGVTLGSAVATDVSYVPASGALGFTVEPARGSWPLVVTIKAPLTGSGFAVTRTVGTFAVDDPSALAFPASVALVSPQTMVQGHSATVTLVLSSPVQSAGKARVWYASVANSATPTLVGSYAVSTTGALSFPLAVAALGPVYFYVKSDHGQTDYAVSGAATVRAYTFPTSFSVASSVFFIEGADAEHLPCAGMVSVEPVDVTATPQDTLAQATIAVSYSKTQTPVGPGAQTKLWVLGADGKASRKLNFATSTDLHTPPVYYLFARVTAPNGAYSDIACATPVTTLLSPLWSSTSTSTTNNGMMLGRFADLGADYERWGYYIGYLWDTMYATPRNLTNTPAYHHNCYTFGNMAGVLTAPHLSWPAGFGGIVSGTWWFRWGYKYPLAIRRCLLFGASVPGTVFTITGYEDSTLSSGRIIATIHGASVSDQQGVRDMEWQKVASPAPFLYYEMRQTVGPWVVGPTLMMVLSP